MTPTKSLLLSAALVVATLFALIAPAMAHQTAASTLIVHIKPEAREVDHLVSVSARDLAHHIGLVGEAEEPATEQLLAATATLVASLSADLVLTNDGVRCEAIEEKLVMTEGLAERVNFLKVVRCERPLGEVTIENRIMLTAPGGYRHFGRVQLGEEVFTTVFDGQFPSYTMHLGEPGADGGATATTSTLDVFVRYLWQGLLHIIIGFDHVLFVICLLFAVTTFRRLLIVVSAFTLGHSVTLGLSALDIFTLPEGLIEPLIALSIAYVAAENIYRKGADVPYLFATTAVFGLIHGFGFSYVLRDEVGLPTGALVEALFAFNVGVELGQLVIVALCFPLLQAARKRGWHPHLVRAASGAILLLALFWLVTRILGI
ncbi:MAG: HupE/UreJ family protein [Bradymonadaceae bacterium]|nr:HupE/UreJ family protein [Lujinxingiaceae bacterium]